MLLRNLKEKRFGRLIAKRRIGTTIDKRVLWLCLCDCGQEISVRSQSLLNGNTKSCGCFHKDQTSKAKTTHGHTQNGRWTPEYRMWSAAKLRAKKNKIKFLINLENVKIPEFCPLLGIKIEVGISKWQSSSPSLDRINSSEGYVLGNVWVISHRANTIKNDACLEELRLIVKGLEKRLR